MPPLDPAASPDNPLETPQALPPGPDVSLPTKNENSQLLPPSSGNSFTGFVVPSATFLAVVLLTLYALPFVLAHWRKTDAQAEAVASYLKRRADLKAEAE